MAARHLLLDLAGVLCRFDSTARLERLAAASRLETAEVDERLYGSGIVDRCDRGELDAAGIRDVLREQLGLDCDDLELPPPVSLRGVAVRDHRSSGDHSSGPGDHSGASGDQSPGAEDHNPGAGRASAPHSSPAGSSTVPPPTVSQPSATTQPRPIPWTIASSVPTAQELTLDVVSNQLRVGTCLARSDESPMPWFVPCSGPHTHEVTRTEDLSARFPTMPTTEQDKVVGDELCPVALRAWMEVTTRLQSQLWVSGLAPLLHRELANKAPFTGTLKGAASK